MSNKKYTRHGKRKEIVFSESDWAIIEKKAADMNIDTTKYIVRSAVNGDTVKVDFKEFSKLSAELRQIGNNINQLAHKANEINYIYKSDYDEMKEVFTRFCHTLNQRISELLRSAA